MPIEFGPDSRRTLAQSGKRIESPGVIKLGKPESLNPNYRDITFTDENVADIVDATKKDIGNANPVIARQNLERLKAEMKKMEREFMPSSVSNQQYATLSVKVKTLEDMIAEHKK